MLKVYCRACASANPWNRMVCQACGQALTGPGHSSDDELFELEETIEPAKQESSPFDDLLGRSLGGYRIESKLGQGGMGAVFLATQLKLDRKVALKLLPNLSPETREPLERFQHEAKRFAALHNPYITQVHDLVEDDGLIGIAMEYAPGGSLRGLLQSQGPLDESNAATIVRQAALGLWEAAKSGLVHRDIKPNNLLLTESGEIKIGDFGLSVIGDMTGPAEREVDFGTPAYMPPEQWEDSDSADHRSDLYALGCTLYELLAGETPFKGPGVADFRQQHREQRPTIPSQLSEVMQAIIARLLEKDPKKRFQTGSELAHHLEPLTHPDELFDTGELQCVECGKENPSEARFCLFCGTRLRKTPSGRLKAAPDEPECCNGCQKELDPSWSVCPWCGASPKPPEEDSLEPGSIFADKLKIIRRVGTGGMGYVFEAEHMILSQPVALKVLRPVLRKNEVFVQRFLTEAKASQAFTHKHAVTVREFGQTRAGSLYMVMDFVRGITLERLMRKQGRLPPVWVLGMCIQVLEALAEAHRAGIVHRDLKPANIMIEKRGNKNWARVVDFGLAKMMTGDAAKKGATRFGTTVGTIIYMSPEQAVAGKLDGRSDLFSLGIILYEMIAGRLPFDDDSLSAVMRKIVHDVPTPLYEAASGRVPRSLSHLVATVLSKRPDDRFPSADHFRRALIVERDKLAQGGAVKEVADQPEPEPANDGGDSVSEWELPAEPPPQAHSSSTLEVEVIESADPLAQPGLLRPPLAGKTIRRVKKRLLPKGLAYVGQNPQGYLEFLHKRSGQTLVLLPGGAGVIGSESPLAGNVEAQLRRVQLPPFLLGKMAVDNASYAIFLLESGHRKPEFWGKRKFRRPEQAVVGTSYADAQRFARWAGLRLPTEVEWEAAASWGADGATHQYPWGDTDPSTATASSLFRRSNPYLNFDNIVGAPSAGDAHAEGASCAGIFDLLGNVFEWTSCDYGGHAKVARGGSWNSNAAQCRSTARLGVDRKTRRSDIGFRIALSFPFEE